MNRTFQRLYECDKCKATKRAEGYGMPEGWYSCPVGPGSQPDDHICDGCRDKLTERASGPEECCNWCESGQPPDDR